VFKREELKVISDLCVKHNLFASVMRCTNGWSMMEANNVRIASLPGMWDRSITIGSAGKSFSATGWKVGWALGPDHLLKHLRTVHQNSVYHCATAAQEAVSYMFKRELSLFGTPDSYFVQLPQELKQKRNRLAQCLTEVGMEPIIPEGSYYMMADISRFSEFPIPPSQKISL
ncbi:kynurenine--oxoglutarate transaminase 1-like, partial [Microcaecilia unicolor]|uniref:Kynurenine--oxoglutarate transaminase 1-like n=1 Tax=Microcaecilia unicolor TaxID=1415580 RepID=A0A6P7X3U1_9AMPH